MRDSAFDASQHLPETANVEQPGGGIGARRAHEQMIGFVLTQHVVEQVGGNRDLPAGLFHAGKTPFYQS